MTRSLFIGVDPGLTTGVFVLAVQEGCYPVTAAAQITGGHLALTLVRAALEEYSQPDDRARVLAIEQFVNSTRASRLATPAGAREARDLITVLCDIETPDYPPVIKQLRPAAAVKPWATDARLEAAGLLDICKGMGHAKDAGRHALFAAVKSGAMRDPLSRKADA